MAILPTGTDSGKADFRFTVLAPPRYNPLMKTLSESALALFRLHVERIGKIDVDDTNRACFQELEQAGLVRNRRPFTGNQLYALTREGAEFKQSLTPPSLSESASPRR